jgi:hypothetical protein
MPTPNENESSAALAPKKGNLHIDANYPIPQSLAPERRIKSSTQTRSVEMNISTARRFSLAIIILVVMLAAAIGIVHQNVSAATVCSPATAISVPYAKDGVGDVCLVATSLCSYINSWNLTTLEVNGAAYTNLYMAASSIAPLNGAYTIHYVSTVAWGHFEIAGTCGPTGPTNTPVVTGPTATFTPLPGASRTSTPGTGPTATRTNTPVAVNTATRTATLASGPTNTPTKTLTPPPAGSTLYVAPNGSDSAPGTISQPTTLTSAITRIAAGGIIYMRAGTYNFSTGVTIARGNNGTSSARKQLFAYTGETPVLNFSAQATDSANRGLTVNGNYWYVKGLIVEHAGDNGIFIGGSNNTIERCITRFNRDTGLQLSRVSSSDTSAQWPANNLIVSCESNDNSDPTGENADGFASKLTTGPGNIFRYDVSHNNSDDGWDLYTKSDTGPIGPVTIEFSIAYTNGTLSNGTQNANGDRNGFKLGGESIAVNHIVRNNLAYNNGKDGFTWNSNPGAITVTSNVSKNNAQRNFNFDGGTSVFSSNISCRSGSGTNDRIIGTDKGNNTWWMGSNGAACSPYTAGGFSWWFNADGSLSYKFQ